MPSVDDLVISLRIDEGSNLSKLKKQLDAIVGPEGRLAPQIGGVSPTIEKNISWIKDRMIYLTPEAIPGDPTGIKTMAASMVKQLKDLPAIGAGILERTGMSAEYIDELIRKLLMITEGIVEGRKAQNIIKWIKVAIDESLRPQGEGWGKSIVEKIEKASIEAQATMVKAFKKAGYEIVEFLQSYMIKPDIIESNKEQIDAHLRNILDGVIGAEEEYKQLQTQLEGIDWKQPLTALQQLGEILNIPITRDLLKFEDTFKTIADPKVAALYVTYIENMVKQLSPILLESFYKSLTEQAKLSPGFGGRRLKVSDITIIGGDIEKIKTLVTGMDQEILEKINYVNLELEKVLDSKELRQLRESAQYFGPTISAATYMAKHIKRAVEDEPTMGVIEKSVVGLLDFLGQAENITSKLENVEQLIESERVGMDKLVDDIINGFVKVLQREKLTGDQLGTLIDGIIIDAVERSSKEERGTITTAQQTEKPKK